MGFNSAFRGLTERKATNALLTLTLFLLSELIHFGAMSKQALGCSHPLMEWAEGALAPDIKRPQSKTGLTPQSFTIPLHGAVPYTHNEHFTVNVVYVVMAKLEVTVTTIYW